jgi:hypothetical protein
MVQLGRHRPLDCIYNLSLGWKGCHIWLLVDYEQRRIQGFRKLSAIVSDDTSSFMHSKIHIKFVVDTSGWHTALTGSTWKTPIALIGGPRRRSRSMVQNCAWGDNSQYYYLLLYPYYYYCLLLFLLLLLLLLLLNITTSALLMIMCYIYHACSAPSNLKA